MCTVPMPTAYVFNHETLTNAIYYVRPNAFPCIPYMHQPTSKKHKAINSLN